MNLKNMFKKFFWGAIIVLFFAILLPQDTLAGTATLTWNANTETDLAGYKVYYGISSRTGSWSSWRIPKQY